jgi:hypothetical protein
MLNYIGGKQTNNKNKPTPPAYSEALFKASQSIWQQSHWLQMDS